MENNNEQHYKQIDNNDWDKAHDKSYMINKYNIPTEQYTYTRQLKGDKWYSGIIYKIFGK